jgi:hypothetical protein
MKIGNIHTYITASTAARTRDLRHNDKDRISTGSISLTPFIVKYPLQMIWCFPCPTENLLRPRWKLLCIVKVTLRAICRITPTSQALTLADTKSYYADKAR